MIVYHLIKGLFNKTFPELDSVKEAIDQSEDKMLQVFNEDIIEEVIRIKRQILDFIRAIKPQKAEWNAAPAQALLQIWILIGIIRSN